MTDQTTPPISERRPDHVAAARSRRSLILLSALGIGMFGFAYANVPYFYKVCRAIGVLPPELGEAKTAVDTPDAGRPLEVYWMANAGDMPIAFSVKNRVQDTTVGSREMNEYRFVNLTKETIYFRPVHDVSPMEAGKESILTLEKCFCFDVQKILPAQEYVLPVIYRFGEDLNPATRTITMSYTLFPSTKEQYDAFMAEAKGSKSKSAQESASDSN